MNQIKLVKSKCSKVINKVIKVKKTEKKNQEERFDFILKDQQSLFKNFYQKLNQLDTVKDISAVELMELVS